MDAPLLADSLVHSYARRRRTRSSGPTWSKTRVSPKPGRASGMQNLRLAYAPPVRHQRRFGCRPRGARLGAAIESSPEQNAEQGRGEDCHEGRPLQTGLVEDLCRAGRAGQPDGRRAITSAITVAQLLAGLPSTTSRGNQRYRLERSCIVGVRQRGHLRRKCLFSAEASNQRGGVQEDLLSNNHV